MLTVTKTMKIYAIFPANVQAAQNQRTWLLLCLSVQGHLMLCHSLSGARDVGESTSGPEVTETRSYVTEVGASPGPGLSSEVQQEPHLNLSL